MNKVLITIASFSMIAGTANAFKYETLPHMPAPPLELLPVDGIANTGNGSTGGNIDMRVISPRDAASGMPTGKRQHKPVSNIGSSGLDGVRFKAGSDLSSKVR